MVPSKELISISNTVVALNPPKLISNVGSINPSLFNLKRFQLGDKEAPFPHHTTIAPSDCKVIAATSPHIATKLLNNGSTDPSLFNLISTSFHHNKFVPHIKIAPSDWISISDILAEPSKLGNRAAKEASNTPHESSLIRG